MRLTLTGSLPSRPASTGAARHMLAALLGLTDADERSGDRLALLITEACANAVRHGVAGAMVDLRIAIEAGVCVLEIGNRGEPPCGGTFPALPSDPEQTGGRGLPLIAAVADRAEFLPSAPGCVLLRMISTLSGQPHGQPVDRGGP